MKPYSLDELILKQNNNCYYCKCEMTRLKDAKEFLPTNATIEHLLDKWASPGHRKINSAANTVAACSGCNNTRGAVRNRIARDYYKSVAQKKGIKLAVASTSSKNLLKMFGRVPQHLFN